MTLAEALAALVRAGRIRSAWMPGMAFGGADGWYHVGRVTDVDERGPWMWEYKSHLCSLPEGAAWYDPAPPLVLTDAATMGCLRALLTEASGDGHATCGPSGADPQGGPYSGPWWCEFWAPDNPAYVSVDGPTEGEALAAALVELAREVTRG